MKITLDEFGIALPDSEIVKFIEDKMSKQEDIHISNELTLTGIRAWLIQKPVLARPKIEWFIYGEQVYFSDDMRGYEGTWKHELVNLSEDFLMTLLGWKTK